jgi:hypothetical protein
MPDPESLQSRWTRAGDPDSVGAAAMQLLKILLWGAFFAVATLFWIVVFEYGFSNIGSNMKAELSGLRELFGTD